tara:strand:+ start:3501 stop:3656 length:156 start_codon:yes stop_codon:yes gene_type:complete
MKPYLKITKIAEKHCICIGDKVLKRFTSHEKACKEMAQNLDYYMTQKTTLN